MFSTKIRTLDRGLDRGDAIVAVFVLDIKERDSSGSDGIFFEYISPNIHCFGVWVQTQPFAHGDLGVERLHFGKLTAISELPEDYLSKFHKL